MSDEPLMCWNKVRGNIIPGFGDTPFSPEIPDGPYTGIQEYEVEAGVPVAAR